MIFSENNYGRFEAIALLLLWVAVGSAAMLMLTDASHLIRHGIFSLRDVLRPVVVVGGLVWLLPSAVSSFREVGEIVRYDHSPIPKPLMYAAMLLSGAIGAMAVFMHRIYLLPYFDSLDLPWTAMTAPGLSMAVLLFLTIFYAGATAWFALFPASRPGHL